MGRVSRPHGIQGEVRVVVSSDNPDRFAVGSVVYGVPARTGLRRTDGGGRRALEIADVRGTAEMPIVAFSGVDSREGAEDLRGLVLQVPVDELPELEDGEFYAFDLEGLEVRALSGSEVVGRVEQVLETPAHDLLAVRLSGGAEVLVPFREEIVPVVDLAGGYVVVDLPRVTFADGE